MGEDKNGSRGGWRFVWALAEKWPVSLTVPESAFFVGTDIGGNYELQKGFF